MLESKINKKTCLKIAIRSDHDNVQCNLDKMCQENNDGKLTKKYYYSSHKFKKNKTFKLILCCLKISPHSSRSCIIHV